MVAVTLTLMVSCKDKLPSNISTSLWWYNTNIESLNKVDSIIINLSDEDINRLSPDSAFSIYAQHLNSKELSDKAYKELEDFLKYSPQYSDYDEVNHKIYHFTITNKLSADSGILKIMSNLDKLYKRHSGY